MHGSWQYYRGLSAGGFYFHMTVMKKNPKQRDLDITASTSGLYLRKSTPQSRKYGGIPSLPS